MPAFDPAVARAQLGLGTAAVLTVDADGTLAADSDAAVPTQRAVKTYVDAQVFGGGGYTDEQAQDAFAAAMAAGTQAGLTFSYNDPANSFSFAVTYGSAAGTACQGDDARLSDSRAPSGAAGGGLSGTYPNPAVATNANLTGPVTSVGNATTIADAELAALAGLTSAADKIPYFTGAGTAALLTRDVDAALSANSDAAVPTQRAVKAYVDSHVAGLLDFKGITDCSANPNYPAALKGDAYAVSFAGKIGGASGTAVDVGDWYVALEDNAGGTEAAVGFSWGHLEHNLIGALLGANNLSDVASAGAARTNLGLAIGTNVQAHDADLDALAALSATAGVLSRTGAGAFAVRTLTPPAAGLTVSDGDGAAGDPTLALANDLAAVEGLATTGLAARTAAETWATRAITGTAGKVTVTNGDGVSGNPTLTIDAAYAGQNTIVTVGTLTGGATGVGFTINITNSTVSGLLTQTHGGTNADLSATGGASQVLKQVSAGASVTVGRLAFSDLTGSLAMSQVAITTDVSASRATSAQSLTQNAWNTLIFNSEATDALSEYDPTTGTFTPAATGLYLITVGYTGTGAIGRGITAVWTGTSAELARVADGTLTQVGGTLMVGLTGGTAYTFRAFPTDAGVTAAVATTALKIRRLS